MHLRVTISGEVKLHEERNRSESEPEQGVESEGVDAKPSDLHWARMRSGYTGWRSAPISVERLLDEVCVGGKGQSSLERARTTRKAFRCSEG